MKVIIPQLFNPSMLVSTGFSESITQWNSTTDYSGGVTVSYPPPGGSNITKIYESTGKTGNINKLPTEIDSTYWFEVKTGNTYAMFDYTVNNQSTIQGTSVTIDLFLATGISALTLINSEFETIDLRLYASSPSGQLLYSKKYIRSNPLDISDWKQYSDFLYVGDNIPITFTDLVNFRDTYLRLTFTPDKNTDYVKIGELVFGTLFNFGHTQRGITSGITDYSIKEADSFGNINFVERNYSKRFNCSVLVNNSNLNAAQKVLYTIRAKPAVWIATEDPLVQEAAVIYGFFKDFSAELTYPEYSVYNLEIEGLI